MVLLLSFSIIFYLIINIIFFIRILITKNPKKIKQSMFLSALANTISFSFSWILLTLDVGLEVIIQELSFAISTGIVVILMIVGICKLKKYKEDNCNNNNMLILLVIILLPLILFLISNLKERILINNGEIIFSFNYQDGIIQSDYYTYVANENKVNRIYVGHRNIDKYTHYDLERKKCKQYYFNIINDEYEIENNYMDNESIEFDKDTVDKILQDAIKDHNKGEDINGASICKVDGCAYYIVTLCSDNSIVSDLLYRNDKCIGDISDSSGSIYEIFIIKK